MEQLVAEFLDGKQHRLAELYQWSFDESLLERRFGIRLEGVNWLDKTLELKARLRERLENADSTEAANIAEYFIKEWGGIRRFSKASEVVEKLSSFAGLAEIPAVWTLDLKGVSSWSKWLTLISPRWACIYDARVAYSINAINYLNGALQPVFPMPDGRNTRLRLLDINTLLLADRLGAERTSEAKEVRREHFIPEKMAYPRYLQVLKGASEALWGDELHFHEVEMLLFAMADEEVYESVFRFVRSRGGRVYR